MADLATQLNKSVWNINNLVPDQTGNAGDVLTTDGTVVNWAPGGGGSPGKAEVRFDFGDATPKNIYNMTANKIILSTEIIIFTTFDDAAATLSLGDAGDVQRFISTTDNVPSVLGTYTTTPGTKYAINTQITLSITPGASTQGSGLVVIYFET